MAKGTEMSKSEHREMLEQQCRQFIAAGGEVKRCPMYLSGLKGGVSQRTWTEIVQKPGKTDLARMAREREIAYLEAQLAAMEREEKRMRKLKRQ